MRRRRGRGSAAGLVLPAALPGLLAGLLLAGPACRGAATGTSAPVASVRTGATEVSPTLEQVFLEPSIAGVAPRADSISADGRWLLVRWSPTEPGSGKPPEPELRLVDVLHPEESGYQGVPLGRLLPPAAGDAEPAADRGWWSHAGHLLAIARGRELWVHDPATRHTALAFRDEAADGTAPAEADGAAHLASEIRSIAFRGDDRELRFMDAEDLYGVPLPAEGLPGTPAALAEARCYSARLDAPAHELQWSDDLATVYGRPTPPVAPDAATPAHDGDPTPEAAEPPAPPPQVWLLDEDRGVRLEGLAAMADVRSDLLSPDGRWVVAWDVAADEEPAPGIVPDWLGERVTTREARGERADDLAPETTVWQWTSTGGRRSVMPPFQVRGAREESAGEAPDGAAAPRPWLRTIGWAPELEPNAPARFALQVRSQDHRERDVWVATEGYSTRVWHERDERWVGGPTGNVLWTQDGRRLLVGSEASELLREPGRNQLFAVDADNGHALQLTDVEGEVSDFYQLRSGGVVIVASRDDPRRREIGIVPSDCVDGTRPPEVRWLPAPPGWNVDPLASASGDLVIFSHESLLMPAELWATDGTRAWPLTRTVPRSFTEEGWIRPVTVSGRAPDGALVRAHVYLPPGVSLDAYAGPPRAAVVFVHGAGYLQNVTDSMTRYPLNAMFHSRLARMGYPVIDVDYRGSKGYGHDFRTDVQYHLGGKDLDDVQGIVDLLVRRGLVDPERVGIYGGSYGGFLTLMALFTAPAHWAVGCALRSVTDWRSYNPQYTQPRLGRPSTNPEAYARSSPIDHVDGLEDPLYLFHGLSDANVFAQDTIRLMEALIDRGKHFDAMLYPSQGHGFDDGHAWLDEYRRIEACLVEHLGPAIRP